MLFEFHRIRDFLIFLAASFPVLFLRDVWGSDEHTIFFFSTGLDRFLYDLSVAFVTVSLTLSVSPVSSG